MVSSKNIIFIVIFSPLYVGAVPTVYPLEDASGPLVETKVGPIRGLHADDGNYSMFMGIPYAEVDPNNPFGPSTPYPMFEDIFDANDDSAICPQVEEFNQTIVGSLDGLHLNIYVPHSASNENLLPVFVWIYGGSFSIGFAGRFIYGPTYLVRHDIILVTLNYRLGPYGFMCLDIPEVPGNQGLKDQLTALRWIKDNIAAFGGDDTRITLSGNSAGSTSADLHLYYDQEDLFHRMIPQSGVALANNVVRESDCTVPFMLAKYLNYSTDDLKDALSYLATFDADQIIAAVTELGLSFRPCVEQKFDNVEIFITDHPINMNVTRVKDIDILIGINNDEEYASHTRMDSEVFERTDFVNNMVNNYFDFGNESKLFEEMKQVVKHFYLGDDDVSADFRRPVINMSSDFAFNHPVIRSVKKYLDNGVETIYLYVFSYSGGRNFFKHKVGLTGGGACHADEIGYLFDISYMEQPLDPADELIIDRMTELWANFVKYGNPTPESSSLVPLLWPQVTPERFNYLELNTELRIQSRPFHHRMAFLDLFYKTNEQYQIYYRTEQLPSSGRDVVLDISVPLLLAIKLLL